MTTKKLIKDYTRKIDLLDLEIATCTEQIRINRDNEDKTYLDEWLTRRQLKNTQRQSYIQFIIDLKSL